MGYQQVQPTLFTNLEEESSALSSSATIDDIVTQ